MSPAALDAPVSDRRIGRELLRRLAPTLVAAVLAAAYVVISPPTPDLAAHLFRAQLFRAEGFGLWDNWWYSGHEIVGYSLLFPAVSAALTPQLAAALAATGSAAVFELLARRHFGPDAWLGAVLFGAATATDLYTGRLGFAFGLLPALGAVLALDRRRVPPACAIAVLTALAAPLAALFTALGAAGWAVAALLDHRRPSAVLAPTAVAASALVPVGLLALAFPEGGSEPFGLATLVPVLVIAGVALVALSPPRLALPQTRVKTPPPLGALRAGVAVYAVALVTAYLVSSPIGSNIARLGTLLAAPIAALVLWRRRPVLLALAALPLLYLECQAPVRDVLSAAGEPSTTVAYYQPLLRFLARQSTAAAGRVGPFRIEVPFTRLHWESYRVAPHFALARGWERQLDIADNPLFYGGHLTADAYERWLHRNAVRFVADPDTPLDYSAQAEAGLISRGQPYLQLVMRSRHWRVYAVADATPFVQGPATLRALGPDSLALTAQAPGTVLIGVRFTPYWELTEGSGCVGPAGAYTRLTLRRAGPVVLATEFALARIGATSPRCT